MRDIGRPRNTCGGLLLEHRPVEGVVVLVVEGPEEDSEELAQIHVVWCLFEAQPAAVVEVHGKLCWETLAQHLHSIYNTFYSLTWGALNNKEWMNWSN